MVLISTYFYLYVLQQLKIKFKITNCAIQTWPVTVNQTCIQCKMQRKAKNMQGVNITSMESYIPIWSKQTFHIFYANLHT
jgi:hypothetical protein